MGISNLEHIDFDTLFRAFERAFSDYEIHFEKEEVRSMLKRRGYDPRLSFAAFDKGEIVAFTLNGIGTFNGTPTAYDTGTGTVKEYRGRGIAGKIFDHSRPYLKDAGIGQYLLEVLQNNHKAISVYRQMGFQVSREFDCFRQNIENISANANSNSDYIISTTDIDTIHQGQALCDFCPSWQNSMESIERGDSELTFLAASVDGKPVGFCVFDPNTGDLTQIAVQREFRQRGIASALLQEAIGRMNTEFIKVINVDSDSETLPTFLKNKNIDLASKQFEMVLPL